MSLNGRVSPLSGPDHNGIIKVSKDVIAIFQERSHLGVIQDLRSCG